MLNLTAPSLLFAIALASSCPLLKSAKVPTAPPPVTAPTPPATHLETVQTVPGADGILVMDLQGGPYFAVADGAGVLTFTIQPVSIGTGGTLSIVADGYRTSNTRLVICPTDCRQADVPLVALPPPPLPPVVVPPARPGPTGTGTSATDPIIAMSGDPAQIARDVRASLAFFGYPATDDPYWIGLCNHVSNGYSDGVWRLGWNRYWETRASPGNTGSANPADGNLPAVHQ